MIVKVSYSLYVEEDYLEELEKREGWPDLDHRALLKWVARKKGTEYLSTIPGHIELLKTSE